MYGNVQTKKHMALGTGTPLNGPPPGEPLPNLSPPVSNCILIIILLVSYECLIQKTLK